MQLLSVISKCPHIFHKGSENIQKGLLKVVLKRNQKSEGGTGGGGMGRPRIFLLQKKLPHAHAHAPHFTFIIPSFVLDHLTHFTFPLVHTKQGLEFNYTFNAASWC